MGLKSIILNVRVRRITRDLDHSDNDVRWSALTSLRSLHSANDFSQRTERALARTMLYNKNIDVVRELVSIMGQLLLSHAPIVHPSCYSALKMLLFEKDEEVGRLAAEALGAIAVKSKGVTLSTLSEYFFNVITRDSVGDLELRERAVSSANRIESFVNRIDPSLFRQIESFRQHIKKAEDLAKLD